MPQAYPCYTIPMAKHTQTKKLKHIIIFGIPGAGKSTLVAKLKRDKLDFTLVNIGDMLRDMGQGKGKLAKYVRDQLSSGVLINDSFLEEIVERIFDQIDGKKMIILDGYPRNTAQVKVLERIFKNKGWDLPYLFHIKITKRLATERLLNRFLCPNCGHTFDQTWIEDMKYCAHCGTKLIKRSDDTPQTIKKRFHFFDLQAHILARHFKKIHHYIPIDGKYGSEFVHAELLKIIKN